MAGGDSAGGCVALAVGDLLLVQAAAVVFNLLRSWPVLDEVLDQLISEPGVHGFTVPCSDPLAPGEASPFGEDGGFRAGHRAPEGGADQRPWPARGQEAPGR